MFFGTKSQPKKPAQNSLNQHPRPAPDHLSAVDDLLRHPDDIPTIGLLLCKTKDRIFAEYALRNISSRIGIAEYQVAMVESLPKDLKSSLPTIKEIETELKAGLLTNHLAKPNDLSNI